MFWKKEKEVTKTEEAQKEPKNEKAYNRIKYLFDTLNDINPSVNEIKQIDYASNQFSRSNILAIKTNLGERFIVLETNFRRTNYIQFCEEKPTVKYGYINSNPLFRIGYDYCGFTNTYSVDIKPRLNKETKITEHQIFLCIKEIEGILSKYGFKTIDEEHKHNVKKFVDRF